MLDRFETFSLAIAGIYRCLHKIEADEMSKFGLKGSLAQYLFAMRRHPEGITAAQLCEMCDKDKAAVSRAITEMEQKGLVERLRSDSTSYRVPLALTSTGETAAQHVCEKAAVAVELAGNGLTDDQRAVFYGALGLIDRNLRSISHNGLPDDNPRNA